MNHRELFILLKNKNKSIDIKGNIKNINPLKSKITTISLIMVCIVFIITYIVEHLKTIKYYPITLYSTNLYSKFAEQILILNKINYQKIYHPVLVNPSYYLSSKQKTINFNPNLKDFNNNVEVPFIPLTAEELYDLSKHFEIDVNILNNAQELILSELPSINAYHICRENYLYDDEYDIKQNQVKYIKKTNQGYYVACENGSFYTSLILSDYTFILQPGDIVTAAYSDNEHIFYKNKYVVDENYQLETLVKGIKNILPCYSLDTPRKGLILHPFHITKSKDLILSIMILVQAVIDMV